MLPRLGLFKTDRLNLSHLVMVDGNIFKPLCIRNPVKHGHLLDSSSRLTCEGCKNHGWTKTLGHIGSSRQHNERQAHSL